MQYIDDLITRKAYKCTAVSPSDGAGGSITVDSTVITVDSTIITADTT
jgi:hypothetical protein